jgi:hypothetical protein
MPHAWRWLLVLIAAAASSRGLMACASSRGAFDGTLYKDGAVAFRVPPLPASWKRIEVEDAQLAFRDEPNDASILIQARCREKDQDVPLVALVNHLIMGTTERDATIEETVPLDGREARHTRMTAKLDGVPRTFDIWVMKKDGCVYDLVYVAAPERVTASDSGVAAFERMVRGFHTVVSGGT